MSNQIDAKIKAKVEEFAQELSGLIHEAAMAAVQQAIAGVMGIAPKRGPGRPVGSGAKKAGKQSSKKAAKKAGRKMGKRGSKKSGKGGGANPALGKAVVDTLSAKPGLSISEIASAVGVAKVDVQPTVVALLAERKIKKTGQRRGTKYFAK